MRRVGLRQNDWVHRIDDHDAPFKASVATLMHVRLLRC